jgi:iron(III) transport system ATP-binding protein
VSIIVDAKQATPTLDASPFLTVRHLSKRFGHFTALKDIHLDVMPGEFVCFLGPSGCGKTTLLRAIAGLDPQSEGAIAMEGRDVSMLPPAARDFGIVFQSYALFPNLTVGDNVGYGLVNRKWPRDKVKARVSELLALVGLQDQLKKYPVQLSGGQQQRVALARALATSPRLLLLDEPLSALDAKVRVHLRDEIKHLQRRLGVTTIMVTHDQEEALSMADTIVVMNQGIVEQVGSPEAIYTHPASPFVADFIGFMNFLPGTVRSSREVEITGARVALANATALPVGAKVRVAIRPEDVRVLRSGDGPGQPMDGQTQAIAAKVAAIAFLGSFCRVSLALARGPTVIADLSAHAMRDLAIETGQHVPIHLPAERLRVFPAAPA